MKKQSEWNKNWMTKQSKKGLCIFCNEPALPNNLRCEKHIFIQIARTNNIKDWTILRDLFYKQDRKCYLTGKPLVLGINASIDHIIPKSKNLQLINDPNNILWCDKTVNLSKSGMSITQFIKMCHDVATLHQIP